MKIRANNPKIGNELVQLIKMGNHFSINGLIVLLHLYVVVVCELMSLCHSVMCTSVSGNTYSIYLSKCEQVERKVAFSVC